MQAGDDQAKLMSALEKTPTPLHDKPEQNMGGSTVHGCRATSTEGAAAGTLIPCRPQISTRSPGKEGSLSTPTDEECTALAAAGAPTLRSEEIGRGGPHGDEECMPFGTSCGGKSSRLTHSS